MAESLSDYERVPEGGGGGEGIEHEEEAHLDGSGIIFILVNRGLEGERKTEN